MDRVSGVLLDGYRTEAKHVLKSKVNRTEVEDMIKKKFDHERGREMEKVCKHMENRMD